METNINYQYISDYSRDFAKEVSNNFFAGKSTIDGREMLNLTPVAQINLFTIKIIFQQWKDEMSRLKSPYFNYQAPEVKIVMKEFMNVLSRNISVDQENFTSLLAKAVQDALLLIFSPYDFYQQEFTRKAKVNLNELKEVAKYIKVNNNLMEAFINQFDNKSKEVIDNEEGLKILNDILANTSELPEDFEPFQQQLSRIKPLQTDYIYQQKKNTNKSAISPDEGQSKPNQENKNGAPATLNDRFTTQQKESLAEVLQKRKIENIKNHISINQRFMFINELFAGDANTYNQALERVDNCQSMNEALNYLQQNHVKPQQWDMESEEVAEFMDVLAKKYG